LLLLKKPPNEGRVVVTQRQGASMKLYVAKTDGALPFILVHPNTDRERQNMKAGIDNNREKSSLSKIRLRNRYDWGGCCFYDGDFKCIFIFSKIRRR